MYNCLCGSPHLVENVVCYLDEGGRRVLGGMGMTILAQNKYDKCLVLLCY